MIVAPSPTKDSVMFLTTSSLPSIIKVSTDEVIIFAPHVVIFNKLPLLSSFASDISNIRALLSFKIMLS